MTPEPVTIVFAARGIYARRERLSYEKIKEQIFAVAGSSAVPGVFGAAHCGSGTVYGPGPKNQSEDLLLAQLFPLVKRRRHFDESVGICAVPFAICPFLNGKCTQIARIALTFQPKSAITSK